MTSLADARAAALDGRFDVAADLAERILANAASCLPALRILAWAQLELGDEHAPRTFDACSAIDPEDALAHVGQAIWHQQRAETDLAIDAWQRAWQLDPHNQTIRRALVKLTGELPDSLLAEAIGLMRAQRFYEADQLLQRAGAEQSRAALLARMTALWALGERRPAFDLAAQVHASDPRCIKAVLFLAALEDRAGRTLHSRELLTRAEQADPGLVLFADTV